MVQAEGMGLAPWGAVGQGMFKTPEEYNDPSRDGRKVVANQPEAFARVSKKLDEIAKRKGSIITSVALAYIMHKAPYTFPILGGRKVEHLKGNIEALALELTDDEIKEIEDAEPFDVGFPLKFLFEMGGERYRSDMTAGDLQLINTNARIETMAPLRVSANSVSKILLDDDLLTARSQSRPRMLTRNSRQRARKLHISSDWDEGQLRK